MMGLKIVASGEEDGIPYLDLTIRIKADANGIFRVTKYIYELFKLSGHDMSKFSVKKGRS